MQTIDILPNDLQNKIAAGEVIERPASVVKELIENSLDAAATEIKVAISHGGKGVIRVTDNGVGMSREDALISFHPHATSKLKREEDLFNIKTMGFRGEALSSISSVSRLIITTAPRNSTLGTFIETEGGKLRGVKEIAYSGTSIEARDLFFNMPARRKFLKSKRTEIYHIVETVTVTALSHPAVAFFLMIDSAETLSLTGTGTLRERLLQVYGDEFLQGLLEIKGEHLRAFISREGNFRSSQGNQYIFVNRRPIRDASLRNALYMAYDTLLPKGRHPLFFLYLNLSPGGIDFNVHPAKREVRIREREDVYRMVYYAVRRVLGYGLRVRDDELDKKESKSIKEGLNFSFQPPASNIKLTPYTQQLTISDIPLITESYGEYSREFSYIYIGDVFLAYSDGSGITLLDHHAAHERVMYEHLLKGINFEIKEMLFPKLMRLLAREYSVILFNLDTIKEMGIELEDFGHNTLSVRAVPEPLFHADLDGIISDVANSLIEFTVSSPLNIIRDTIAKKIACHNSVRGKMRLAKEELMKLVKDLSETEDPEHCPHGRPTKIHLNLAELKKMFKRTG